MINDIAIVIILVLVAIGTLIAVFLLGRYVEQNKDSKYKDLAKRAIDTCTAIDKENKYLRSRLGLNELDRE